MEDRPGGRKCWLCSSYEVVAPVGVKVQGFGVRSVFTLKTFARWSNPVHPKCRLCSRRSSYEVVAPVGVKV